MNYILIFKIFLPPLQMFKNLLIFFIVIIRNAKE